MDLYSEIFSKVIQYLVNGGVGLYCDTFFQIHFFQDEKNWSKKTHIRPSSPSSNDNNSTKDSIEILSYQ